MRPDQLKATTMDPATRTLLRVVIPEESRAATEERIEHLMGRKPELRLAFIQEHAGRSVDLDV
jgi:topoisomerase-4 subunit B